MIKVAVRCPGSLIYLPLSLLLLAAACRPKEQVVVSSSPHPEGVARDSVLGTKVLRGRLARDKGAMVKLQGVFIRITDARYMALSDTVVEARGIVRRHFCGPTEQCLSQGYMDFMDKPEYIRPAAAEAERD